MAVRARRFAACSPRGVPPAGSDTFDAEIAAGAKWIYPWRSRDGRRVGRRRRFDHSASTRRAQRLIEPAVRAALQAAGAGAVSARPGVQRGLVFAPPARMGRRRRSSGRLREPTCAGQPCCATTTGSRTSGSRSVQGDVFDSRPRGLGQFDVVLLLGLIYHVEDPTGAIRLARGCTRGVCAIETQLTRQN